MAVAVCGGVPSFAAAGASGCCASDGSAAAKAAQNTSISQRALRFTDWTSFLMFSTVKTRDPRSNPIKIGLIPFAGFLSTVLTLLYYIALTVVNYNKASGWVVGEFSDPRAFVANPPSLRRLS